MQLLGHNISDQQLVVHIAQDVKTPFGDIDCNRLGMILDSLPDQSKRVTIQDAVYKQVMGKRVN